MSIPSSIPLMPVGSQINHNGRPLYVIERLNSGLTGEVYKGRLSLENGDVIVAVKVMKTLDFPMALQLFKDEGLTLSLMMEFEKETNEKLQPALKIAPIYYGYGELGELKKTPYIVMEFIQGKEIPKLLLEAGKFPEVKALTAAWHLFRTLDIMHTRLKKSYIDLKFNNLWWVETDDGIGQLKLTDFGTLEEIKPNAGVQRGISQDILLGGVYLFAMLTGITLDYSMGSLRERAEPLIRKAELTWGTKQLLFQILHRNPEKRITQAGLVASELSYLVKFWTESVERVGKLADTFLQQAEGEADHQGQKAREKASRARTAYEIIKVREPGQVSGLSDNISRADTILNQSDYLERGKALFMGYSYGLAREIFEEGLHWSSVISTYRRWAYLARIGEEISPVIFNEDARQKAIQALELLEKDNWIAANERLDELSKTLDTNGIRYLAADCNLFFNLDQAEKYFRNRDYLTAGKCFRAALQELDKLPDHEIIINEEVGELLQRAQEVEELDRTIGEARRQIEIAKSELSNNHIDTCLNGVREAYRASPEYELLPHALNNLSREMIEKGHLGASLETAILAMNSAPNDSEIRRTASLANLLVTAERKWADGDVPQFITIVNESLSEYRDIQQRLPSIQRLLKMAGMQVHGLSESEIQSDIQSINQQWIRKAQQTIDLLIAEATEYYHVVDFDSHVGLNEVEAIVTPVEHKLQLDQPVRPLTRALVSIQDAWLLAAPLNYRLEQIAELSERIKSEISREKEEKNQRLELINKNAAQLKSELSTEWEDITNFGTWYSGSREVGVAEDLRNHLRRQHQIKLHQFIEKCYLFLYSVNNDDLDVSEWKRSAENAVSAKLGISGWNDLIKNAQEQVNQISGKLENAQVLFNQGQEGQSAASLEQIKPLLGDSPEWNTLTTRIKEAQRWKAWLAENQPLLQNGAPSPDILARLRNYIDLHLPYVYYQPVMEILDSANSKAANAVKEHINIASNPEFIELIKSWLNIEWTRQQLEGLKTKSTRVTNGDNQ